MDKILIIIHRYFISCIDIMNRCDIWLFLCIEWIDSIFITCIINYLCWILMRWYFFTSIVVIHYFIIDASNWILIGLFFQSNESIWWYFGMIVDTRNIWFSYNIITFLCIRTVCFTAVEIWVNSNTYLLLIIEWNLPPLFYSW